MRRVRDLFLKNTWLKIVSLFLALVLWLVVFQGDEGIEQAFTVPVQVVPGPSSVVMEQSVLMVKVDVEGSPLLLRRFLPAGVVARIPLASEEEGEVSIEISPENLGLPRELRVVSIAPPAVTVRVEPKERKRVPILPVLDGEAAAGFRVASVRKKPSTVVVEGARSEVAAIRGVPTRPVDISGRKESFQREVLLSETGKRTVMLAEDVMVKVRVHIEADPDYVAPESPAAGPAAGAETNAS
ncbi:MAG: YbbR-like domain-containing protein [Myxococcota bacterium]